MRNLNLLLILLALLWHLGSLPLEVSDLNLHLRKLPVTPRNNDLHFARLTLSDPPNMTVSLARPLTQQFT